MKPRPMTRRTAVPGPFRFWSRPAGVGILLIMLIGGCTGKGCRSCQGCSKCGPSPEEAAQTRGRAGETASGPSVKEEKARSTAEAEEAPGSKNRPETERETTSETEALSPEEYLEKLAEEGEGLDRPSPPAGLRAIPAGAMRVLVEWQDNSPSEIQYQVDRADKNGSFATVFRLPANTTQVIDGPLPPGTYSYRVRALSSTGASPFAGPVSVSLKAPENPPAAPRDLAAFPEKGALKIALAWRDNSDNEQYFKVERKESGSDFAAVAFLPAQTTFYSDPVPEPGALYTYRVIAGNAAGESPASNEASAKAEKPKAPPAAPANLREENRARTTTHLAWEDRSDNESSFCVEELVEPAPLWRRFAVVPANQTTLEIPLPPSGESRRYRVLAENEAGKSEPSNEVEVQGKEPEPAMFTIVVDPSGRVTVEPRDPGSLVQLEVLDSGRENGNIAARITVKNLDPQVQLEEVYVLAESADKPGIYLLGCDRGPEDCSVDRGLESGTPAGYQYVEGGFRGKALHGAEMEEYPTVGIRYPVRDIWPACGRVSVKWTFAGVTETTRLGVNIYADYMPEDFRKDPRFDPDKLLYIIEPYSLGAGTELYRPGARDNPTTRPVNFLRPGEVFAVNISVEAADWMENQPEIGRADLGERARYIYWQNLNWDLSFDPSVILPIKRKTATPLGEFISPGLQDPMTDGHDLDDGWSASRFCFSFINDKEGWALAIFDYPPFQVETDESGREVCVHCGQEGFTGPEGIITGPDPEPEVTLGLLYFQVVGEPGDGTALRLIPRPHTSALLLSTEGKLKDRTKHVMQDSWLEVNMRLPSTLLTPGDYQVQESFICVK